MCKVLRRTTSPVNGFVSCTGRLSPSMHCPVPFEWLWCNKGWELERAWLHDEWVEPFQRHWCLVTFAKAKSAPALYVYVFICYKSKNLHKSLLARYSCSYCSMLSACTDEKALFTLASHPKRPYPPGFIKVFVTLGATGNRPKLTAALLHSVVGRTPLSMNYGHAKKSDDLSLLKNIICANLSPKEIFYNRRDRMLQFLATWVTGRNGKQTR